MCFPLKVKVAPACLVPSKDTSQQYQPRRLHFSYLPRLCNSPYRALMHFGDEWPRKYNLSSLRVLGSVGEPINPEAWRWYFNIVGQRRCSVVDTYWQTETGGHIISPFPGATCAKPGCAMVPFFGIEPAILDAKTGVEKTENGVHGVLCIKRSWPGMSDLYILSFSVVKMGMVDWQHYMWEYSYCLHDEKLTKRWVNI